MTKSNRIFLSKTSVIKDFPRRTKTFKSEKSWMIRTTKAWTSLRKMGWKMKIKVM